MERSSNTSFNKPRAVVLKAEPSIDADTQEKVVLPETAVLTLDQQTAPPATPDTDLEGDEPTPLPPEKGQKDVSSPKFKKPMGLILAVLGVVAGVFSYHWWQYASTHESTDDATVAGNVHPVSSRINGTVAEVLVNDNQLVQTGQLLVKLDPRDYQIQVQQAEASLESARRQANAAEANINLASGNAEG